MKVSDVGSVKRASARRRKKTSEKGGDFADHLRRVGAAAEGSGNQEAPPVSPLDVVLVAQAAPDARDQRSRGRARQHGEDILDRLDKLRHELLAGLVSREELAELARRVRAYKATTDDPQLNQIIDEIELRAQVEIAKLTRDA